MIIFNLTFIFFFLKFLIFFTENNDKVTNENDNAWNISKVTRGGNAKSSNSKPVVKHALRQQAKRRRKNTTIAAGNVAPIPRIVHPSNQVNGNYLFNKYLNNILYIYICTNEYLFIRHILTYVLYVIQSSISIF